MINKSFYIPEEGWRSTHPKCLGNNYLVDPEKYAGVSK